MIAKATKPCVVNIIDEDQGKQERSLEYKGVEC